MSTENDPVCSRLQGRIDYLREIGRVKDPELMMAALENLSGLADACQFLINDLDPSDIDGAQQTLINCCLRYIKRAKG